MIANDADEYIFGPFRLDTTRRELLAHGVPVVLGQRALDVLLALIRRRGLLATKDEIMAEVWPGVIVEENNLQVHVSALRKVLASAGDGERYLVTVAGRGYRFVAPVAQEAVAASQPSSIVATAQTLEQPRASLAPARTLPVPATSLIGREKELTAIDATLRTHRLITLCGPGGVGKTRLAIEAGHQAMARYADGVWFCELAALSDPQAVIPAISMAIGVTLGDTSAPLQTLERSISSRHLLLVIDNCEHLIIEVARAAESLIRHCPRMTILATSRERLAVDGESVLVIPPLAVPGPQDTLSGDAAVQFPAVRLFQERACALGGNFRVTDDNATTVAAICRALDGLPLALEMAVPRLKVMSPQQLSAGLDERFRLLKAGSRTALPRQQTLHALIAWSYDLLTPNEQTLLRRLSVFAGATRLDAIAPVVTDHDIASGEIFDLLSSLVEKSLVIADVSGHEPSYQLLESTKSFAGQKLVEAGEAVGVSKRHAAHFAAHLARASDAWETVATAQWLATYAADVDNVRAAFAWAFGVDGDVDIALDLTGRGHELWAELGLVLEHRQWVAEALKRINAATPDIMLARVLSWQAGDIRDLGDSTDGDDAERAARIYAAAGDVFSEAKMLLRAGATSLDPNAPQKAEQLLRTSLSRLEPFGHTKALARCLSALASARLFAGDRNGASSLHAKAIATYGAIGEAE